MPSLRVIQFFHAGAMISHFCIASRWDKDQCRIHNIFLNHRKLHYINVERFTLLDASQYVIECKRFTLASTVVLRTLVTKIGHAAGRVKGWREQWWRDRESILSEVLLQDQIDV